MFKVCNNSGEVVSVFHSEFSAKIFAKVDGRSELSIFECDWNTHKKIREVS